MKTFNFYSAFVSSDSFKKAIEAIPSEAIRKAIWHYGIGDSLTQVDGKLVYDFEGGNLLESEVKELLDVIEDSEYRTNYDAICKVAIAYEEWANEQKEKPDLGTD